MTIGCRLGGRGHSWDTGMGNMEAGRWGVQAENSRGLGIRGCGAVKHDTVDSGESMQALVARGLGWNRGCQTRSNSGDQSFRPDQACVT